MTTPKNPPLPIGYHLLAQTAVTPAMTAWAVQILHDASTYPLFATTTAAFGALLVLARVEWHAPDFQNHAPHRGVTLYQRTDSDMPQPYTEGIDVSHYQPNIDWHAVAAGGVSFAFIKATEGAALVDGMFEAHGKEAKAAGVLRGAYHFFRPKVNAAAQARLFLAQLGDRGELPPVIDVEVADGVGAAAVVQGVAAFVDSITASIGRPIIYTSPGFWNARLHVAEARKRRHAFSAGDEGRSGHGRNYAATVTSTNSPLGSSPDSKQRAMASEMLASASSRVLPCEMHPGRTGHSATIHPSSPGRRTTGSFVIAPDHSTASSRWPGHVRVLTSSRH